MTFATLRALHAVIGAALEDMERVYRERAPNLDFPSLDDPYYVTAQHTPEEELAESLRGDPAVAAASKNIVAACGQLNAIVNKPWFGLMEDVQSVCFFSVGLQLAYTHPRPVYVLQGQFAACIRFMETANVVEILREAGPEGMHVKDIYTNIMDLLPKNVTPKIPTMLNPTALSTSSVLTSRALPYLFVRRCHVGHILRLLATSHYLREVKPDVFANNRRSSYVDSGKNVAQLREAYVVYTYFLSAFADRPSVRFDRPESKYTDTDGVAAFVALTYVLHLFLSYLTESSTRVQW